MNCVNNLNQIELQYIKGVGPRRAQYLKKLNILSVEDLLFYLPKRHEDRREFISINQCQLNEFQTVQGIVCHISSKRIKKLQMLEVEISDSTGTLTGIWFNQSYLKKQFAVGQQVVLSGRVQWRRKKQISSPEYEIFDGDDTDLIHTGRIVPIYALTEGLNQRTLRQIIKNTLELYKDQLVDYSPQLQPELKWAIDQIHFPENFSNRKKSHEKLVFNEFLLLQLGIQLRKKQNLKEKRPVVYTRDKLKQLSSDFQKCLPFQLTQDQLNVIENIIDDLTSENNLNRLIQGDVGSGKTVIAAFALLIATQHGFQGAFLAPTEILAEQHYQNLKQIMEPFHLRIAILTGNRNPKERRHFLRLLQRGEIHILIGTHAIIQEDVHFHQLAMAVIDEQHRFGVEQRAMLKNKTHVSDILLMSATPIPRSLGLTLYGDLDKSIIKEKPPGRGKLTTHWIQKERLPKVYQFIREQALEQFQSFIICPLVEESEKLEIQAAVQKYNEMKNHIFPDLKVGLIHGRMKSLEKESVIEKFALGEISILVSTTVIEVGIDIPRATVILIENAERFGLAQLHQLRGRIGRNQFRSYCILHGDPKSEEGIQRLQIMESTHDGFKIAEADFMMRGPGEILGKKQHGLPQLRIGNLITDFKILEQARDQAEEILQNDPLLTDEMHQIMKTDLINKFDNDFGFYEVG